MSLRHILCTILLVNTLAVEAHDYIKETIPTWMKENNIPGVVVQIYDHGQAHSYYFGIADKATQKPVTGDTIFEVGSISKVLTELLLAQQLIAGSMSLSDPTSQYLSDLTQNSRLSDTTMANLALYTADLPFETPSTITTRSQLATYFKTWKPTTAIGSHWAYSNVSIGLLGYALERATHKSMNQLYRENILAPLHMQPIGLLVPKKWQADYAQGYNIENKPAQMGNRVGLYPSAYAIKMTAEDSQRFLQASLGLSDNEQINKAMRLTQTAQLQVTDWQLGLGWEIKCAPLKNKIKLLNPPEHLHRGPLPAQRLPLDKQKFDPTCLYDKTGGTHGFRAYFLAIPSQKTGVVILTNRMVSNRVLVTMGRKILFNLLAIA